MKAASINAAIPTDEPVGWNVQVFYDGDCPLCVREVAMLARRDAGRKIWFTNIADPEFSATLWGTSQAELMAKIRGRLPEGQWIEGVEVFRLLYTAAGFAPLVSLSRLPGVSQALNVGYELFAKNRLRWTGRCDDTCDIHQATAQNGRAGLANR